ncbi:unnamed protein product, partial [Mesorhabditis belari]|uniref:Uncharacterized protein n=1 Tax=Mesorhabditis belari TaxID=2138241 RepID=A0AAF3FG31_9BILA
MGNRPSVVQSTYPRHGGPPWGPPHGVHGIPTTALPSRHPPPRFGSAPPRPQSLYERTPYSFVPHQGPPPPPPGHPHSQLRRSQMSLNGADSGYMTSPGDSDRAKRASRLSLHEFAFDARPIIMASPKTMKKLEKRHKKMLKKMGAKMPPIAFAPGAMLPPPQMHPMRAPPPPNQFQRAISFDNLHRHRIDIDRAQKEAWIEQMRRSQMAHPRVESTSTAARSSSGRGSLSPSPLTTSSPFASSPSESQNNVDGWTDNRRSDRSMGMMQSKEEPRKQKDIRERKIPVQILTRIRPESPVHYETARAPINAKPQNSRDHNHEILQELNPSPAVLRERVHNIERVEKRISTSCTYAQPIPRDRNSRLTETGYSSCRSSVSGMPRGDQSEIDFSWVRDEEKKLNDKVKFSSNREASSSLPEFYFGMDPPKINVNEKKEINRPDNMGASPRMDADVRTKLAFFEREAREAENERRKSLNANEIHDRLPNDELLTPKIIEPRSYHEIPSHGPAERRLQRISRNLEAQHLHDQYRVTPINSHENCDRKWRSSMAF